MFRQINGSFQTNPAGHYQLSGNVCSALFSGLPLPDSELLLSLSRDCPSTNSGKGNYRFIYGSREFRMSAHNGHLHLIAGLLQDFHNMSKLCLLCMFRKNRVYHESHRFRKGRNHITGYMIHPKSNHFICIEGYCLRTEGNHLRATFFCIGYEKSAVLPGSCAFYNFISIYFDFIEH